MAVSVIAAIYPIVALRMLETRASYFGVFLVIFACLVFLHGKGKKTTLIRLGTVTLVAIVGITVLVVAAYIMFRKNELTGAYDDVNYFWFRLMGMFDDECPYETYFTPGTLIYAIDIVSSGRLVIWYDVIKNMGWFGSNGNHDAPHNLFLQEFVANGIVGGTLFLAWYVLYMIYAIKGACSNKKSVTYMFAMLFSIYMFGNYFVKCLDFNTLGGFFMLIGLAFLIEGKTDVQEQEEIGREQ